MVGRNSVGGNVGIHIIGSIIVSVVEADVWAKSAFRVINPQNVGGADPLGRTGQSTKGPTHLIKVSVESALSLRLRVDVFGTDYPTPNGTCI
jgi:UDP-glucose 4-epimerase